MNVKDNVKRPLDTPKMDGPCELFQLVLRRNSVQQELMLSVPQTPLLEESLERYGAGRSVVVDRHDRVIGE